MSSTVRDEENAINRPTDSFENAGFFSKLAFLWVLPLIKTGAATELQEIQLPDLDESEKSIFLLGKLDKEWEAEQRQAESAPRAPSLLRAFWRVFRTKSLLMFVFLSINAAIRIFQAVLLGFLIGYFSNPSTPNIQGYTWAAALAFISLIETVMHHHFYFWGWRLGLQMRIVLTTLLYKKSLKLQLGALSKVTTGYVINLATNDIERFQMVGCFAHFVIAGPLSAIAVLIIGVRLIGVSFIAGWAVLVLFVPLQMQMSKLFGETRRAVAVRTDERIKLTNQAVSGARLMKLSGWENPFAEAIHQARVYECEGVLKANNLRALNEALYFITPLLLALVTFTTFVFLGNVLTSQKVFTVMALFNFLQMDLTKHMALGIQACSEAWVSLKRLEVFLALPEVASCIFGRSDQPKKQVEASSMAPSFGFATKTSHPLTRILINGLSFKWVENDTVPTKERCLQKNKMKVAESNDPSQETSQMTLKELNLRIYAGELFVFIGQVGSAKSSLLMAILNEMIPSKRNQHQIEVCGQIAFASQEPWIISGTIQDNIIFGKTFDNDRYATVIQACCLQPDLQLLPEGDMTIIGDRGVNLSGGQRARIGLARLAYNDTAEIYLMDDALSAVDPAVGRHLFEQVICTLLASKTRLLVTHQLQYLQHNAVSNICVLENGSIKGKGRFRDLVHDGLISSEFLKNKEEENQIETLTQEAVAHKKKESHVHEQRKGHSSTQTPALSLAKEASGHDFLKNAQIDQTKSVNKEKYQGIVTCEEKNTGTVSWATYREYIQEMGGYPAVVGVLFLLTAAQGLIMYTGAFLALWSSKTAKAQQDPRIGQNFTLLVLGSLVFCIARSLGTVVLLIYASRRLHTRMLTRILRAPINFFDSNPLGRIMNRFSKDLGLMDDQLAMTIYDFLQSIFLVIGAILFIGIINPWVFLVLPILIYLFIVIRNFSQNTSRQVKRLEAVSRSPIYSTISETLDGLSTIRAFGEQQRFLHAFCMKLDTNTRSYYQWLSTGRWLGFYLDMLVVLMIAASAIISVVINTTAGSISGALLGVALTYIVQLADLFQWTVRQSAEVENQMVSVERVLEYCHTPQESALISPPDKKPPPAWPQNGEIKATNLSAQYHPLLPPVLKNVSFKIKGGERVGIVGRTGAGKSSFVAVLFRLIEQLPGGKLEIDGYDISELGLHDLRLKMSVIPQTPFLFAGTIKQNLDPFNKPIDEEKMWSALEAVQMANLIRSLPNGLDTRVAESGGNWSVGQRQLLCLARALLASNRILVMDEATANIDLCTDSLIQEAVRTRFKDCTVIMIAHRLHTVIDCDKVLVLGSGQVLEFGSPYELLESRMASSRANSFLSMVNETGVESAAELKKLAHKYERKKQQQQQQ